MKIFQGVIVPMVTPINKDYNIDSTGVQKTIDLIVNANCAPFVLGTTGEFTSFRYDQKIQLVKDTVSAVDSREKVFAGISSTSLLESIDLAKRFSEFGADIMVTTLPFYYPISDAEMLRFFEELADRANCPIIIYNMPAMVGASIPLEIAEQLSYHPNIVGMKDSERDIDRINQSMKLWKDREDFSFYLGWAAQSAHCMLNGADGIVPSTGNLVPDLFKQLYDAGIAGEEKLANNLQLVTDKISLIYQKDRKLNTSLPALKVLMSELSLCEPYVLPPMYNIVQDEQVQLKAQFRNELNKLSSN